MALPQECLESLAKKYGMEIKGDIWANPENERHVSIHLDKILVIPELGTLKNEFGAGVEIVNWKKIAETYGKKEFKPYNYEVRVYVSAHGYETFWMRRTLQGNDIHALLRQACSIIEGEYNKWLGFLERKKRRLLGREEGLWKWVFLIPIAGLFLFRRR